MKKTPVETQELDVAEESNVISLMDAKKLPKPQVDFTGPKGVDWLSSMKAGTEFKCRDKTGRTPRWLVIEYTHLGKLQGDVLLCPTVSVNEARTWFWVEPVGWCTEWEFRGIISEQEEEDD